MSKKVNAWSFSRLKNFEQCPKKFYHTSIRKDVIESQNDTMLYGNRVHKVLELRVKNGKRLPMDMTHLESIAAKFADPKVKPDEILTEQQLAIDENYQPCDWFSKDTWTRAIIDYLAIRGDSAVLVDYKTGKMYDDFTQLKMAAALLFLFRPEINTIKVVYWWTKEKSITSDYFCREDMPELWSELLPRVERYNKAFDADEFPAKQNYLCKRYCPVKQCKWHGE